MPNPSNFKDLTKQTFHNLFVVKRAENDKQGRARWECKCSCGNTTIIKSNHLISNRTRSCGCIRVETTKKKNLTHGMSKSVEYKTWKSMIDRCTNPKCRAFKNYGGRGITICPEWRHNFMAFYNYIGKRPSLKHTIERINNNSGYKPTNVCWATRTEQANNYRRNVNIMLHGWVLNITQWAKFTGIPYFTLRARIRYGWPPAKAIFQKVSNRKQKH